MGYGIVFTDKTAFRVPLDAQEEWIIRKLDSLNNAVFCVGNDLQTLSRVVNDLVVETVDGTGISGDGV